MISITADGRLTDFPVLKTTGGGTTLCTFTIASDKERGEDGADFLQVIVFKGAEDHAKHLVKGQLITIRGHLNHNRWNDKETGDYRERYELVADTTQWGAKPRNGQTTEATPEPAAA